MDQLTDDALMSLPEFRAVLRLSPSNERRRRREQQDWPPHLAVGRKVFYFRAGVMEWLARQEASQAGVLCLGANSGMTPQADAAIQRRAAELAAKAPALTPEQVLWLRAVLAPGGAGHAARSGKADTLVEAVRVR